MSYQKLMRLFFEGLHLTERPSYRLEQLSFKLEKILGSRNLQGKLENIFYTSFTVHCATILQFKVVTALFWFFFRWAIEKNHKKILDIRWKKKHYKRMCSAGVPESKKSWKDKSTFMRQLSVTLIPRLASSRLWIFVFN